ncbi:hypothetical protein Q3A86_32750 [Streptomyces sp. NBUA17]|uniref:hypothetical protein n=2 Tax=Streptomyces sp. NBUA17 TaxID=3062275 RepID=UPI0037DA44FA
MRKSTLPRHARTGLLAVGWRKPRPGEDGMQPIYPILGGADDDDDGDDDADDDQDDADDKPGKGKSDKDDDGDGTDWKAEAEKWKAQSRKHEERAKANAAAAKERDRLRREGMPEQERKIEEAVAKALGEERSKNGAKLARQAFLAAAKGVIDNASDVADDVNLSRYVKDDGEIDEDGLAELVKRLAPKGSDTDDEDDDQDERDTRRRRRQAGGRQGARNGSGRSKDTKRGAVDGAGLFEELLGRKPQTSRTT